jgi:epoxyqueuosine reductase
MDLKAYIIEQARTLGFDRIGFAGVEPLPEEPLQRWLANDYHDGMAWMGERLAMRLDPEVMMPGARTVIVLAANYFSAQEPTEDPRLARIARYAWGEDYHRVLQKRLKTLLTRIREIEPAAEGRLCVDSAPIMEKEWARRAGIGWRGKNSLILAPELGSWIFLCEIVTNLELPPDHPVEERCGSCTKCLEACPTGALVAPYIVDTRRCLACLTIETEEEIPAEYHQALGNRVFGCDICQEACPWNRQWARPVGDPAFHPRPHWLSTPLTELITWSETQFREAARHSPLQRRGYDGFVRNVKAALQNLPE